ncbi:SGNH/GDSL hydrolase family protein [Puniceicoccus vermicola]|nr:SGNH/GDSL hydrolase family protein [Puniceicoccus vermicola]
MNQSSALFSGRRILLTACVVFSAGFFSAVQAESVDPDDEAIRYVGRFTEDYRFAWTGAEIETLFQGSTIAADLQVVAAPPAGLTVVVDGEPHFLKIGPGRGTYTLAEGLDPNEVHRISVVKRSEGARGTVKFYGFELPDGGELMRPDAPDRRILVIGDSITCGYGNEASDPKEGNTVENENGYMSYALIAARELDADAMLICWSGRGMYRNRGKNNDQKGTLPMLFDQTLPFDGEIEWDHSRFVPDVIVINLGTNDSAELNGAKPPLPKEGFVETYTEFLKRLREMAPDSVLILSIGPMQSGPVAGWLPEIAEEFDNASVLIYSKFQGKEDIGGHWHPSVLKDQKMAQQLVEVIEASTGWTTGSN